MINDLKSKVGEQAGSHVGAAIGMAVAGPVVGQIGSKLGAEAGKKFSEEQNSKEKNTQQGHEQKVNGCLSASVGLVSTISSTLEKLTGGHKAGFFGAGAKPEAINQSQSACDNALPKLQALQPGNEKELDDSNSTSSQMSFSKNTAAA
jgi:hypothetical protein